MIDGAVIPREIIRDYYFGEVVLVTKTMRIQKSYPVPEVVLFQLVLPGNPSSFMYRFPIARI
jgi:hypothetical protein